MQPNRRSIFNALHNLDISLRRDDEDGDPVANERAGGEEATADGTAADPGADEHCFTNVLLVLFVVVVLCELEL